MRIKKKENRRARIRAKREREREELEAMASWSLLPAFLKWNSLAWRNGLKFINCLILSFWTHICTTFLAFFIFLCDRMPNLGSLQSLVSLVEDGMRVQ